MTPSYAELVTCDCLVSSNFFDRKQDLCKDHGYNSWGLLGHFVARLLPSPSHISGNASLIL